MGTLFVCKQKHKMVCKLYVEDHHLNISMEDKCKDYNYFPTCIFMAEYSKKILDMEAFTNTFSWLA
jgi:hypothetical protein